MAFDFLKDCLSFNRALYYVKVRELLHFIQLLLDYSAAQTGPQYFFLNCSRLLPWFTTAFESFPEMMHFLSYLLSYIKSSLSLLYWFVLCVKEFERLVDCILSKL